MSEPAQSATVSVRHQRTRSGSQPPPPPPSSSPASPQHFPLVADRFTLTYLRRELRGRLRQAILIALGLGFGVGLVITVTAASAGVRAAQSAVLHSLYGIGTDLTVTEPVSAPDKPSGNARGGPQRGTLQTGSLEPFPSSRVSAVAGLAHVASAAGGLELSELTVSGSGVPEAIPVEGVEVGHPELGPLASGILTSGHDFSATDSSADVAVLDADYADANKLSVGSTVDVAGASFQVIGLISQNRLNGATDIYIPLDRAQALARSSATGASLTGDVDVVYAAAVTSGEIPDAQAEIGRLLPSATVTDTDDLAAQVSGSLASAATLTGRLGEWVAAAALLAAFCAAGLLTAAAVNRRTRELGTLKALGWTSKRIATQIISESAATGTMGAVLGVTIGYAGAVLVNATAPELSATIPRQTGSDGTATVAVHLAAHLSPTAAAAAAALAVAGALIAGTAGARRATRLRPADAFSRIG
jgi:putative ABC transport system permease protein